MVEVAHEALIHNWQDLQEWLKENWEKLRQKQKIERAATEWQNKQKLQGYLLQGRMLRDAKEFLKTQKDNPETSLSSLAVEFVTLSQKKQKTDLLKKILIIFIVPSLILTPLIFHFGTLLIANQFLYQEDCHPHPNIGFFLKYLVKHGGKKQLTGIQLCDESMDKFELPGVFILDSNFERVNLSSSNLKKSILVRSNFRGAFLVKAQFNGSVLIKSDFRCSVQNKNAKCSELLNTNFENANLREAKFQGAILKNTNFKGADLTKANLSGAKKLTVTQLEDSILCQTLLPKYLDISEFEMSKNNNCTID